MPTPQERLAQSLELLQRLQREDGSGAIRSKDLPRTDRERLVKNGFIKEVMKGWYIPDRADDLQGDSTAWYASFWQFSAAYLNDRFEEEWSLSPEQSLALHAGNWSVPSQLLVRSPKASNNVTKLLHGTSILDVRTSTPSSQDIALVDELRLYSLESALITATPTFYRQSPTDARAALSMVKDASSLLDRILDGGHSTIAGRLVGAFRNIGRDRIADDIMAAMTAADYTIQESDPFEAETPITLNIRDTSPCVTRLRLLWQQMRGEVIDGFPETSGASKSVQDYMNELTDKYVTDAYHSLSIEGYRVSTALIDRVRKGDWNPDKNAEDRNHRDAMAARGYYLAFQSVRESVKAVLEGKNAGEVADRDHGNWYRELFAPSVSAGILKPSDLAGYRRGQVFIRGSMHVPMKRETVPDAMNAFFNLLQEEDHPAVRVVLGHFFFVNIHPYMDGNGRIGRFLMNVMMAAGGYPWTIIPVEKRESYMVALEEASVHQNIRPFAEFLGGLVGNRVPEPRD